MTDDAREETTARVPGQVAEGGAPTEPKEPTPPGRGRQAIGPWMRQNLFGTWYDSLLTLALSVVLAYAAFRVLRFVFVSARWTIIRLNLTNLMVGLFPRELLVRPWIALFVGVAFLGLTLGVARQVVLAAAIEAGDDSPGGGTWWDSLRRAGPILGLFVVLAALSADLVTTVLIVAILGVSVAGFLAGRRVPSRFLGGVAGVGLVGIVAVFAVLIAFGGVGWNRWGGLLLTLFLAVSAIVLSFPFGIALALGRRSSFPAVRVVCVSYIELFRGVPLITVLFMGSLMLLFFVPRGFSVPGIVMRAVIALTLFTAAYVAEIVRGGLQSVPRGQIEAAQAVGLSPIKVTRLIVLPQALRAVIPALVGQFISLFKDTSLVFIIGLVDLLFVAQRILPNQPRFAGQGLQAETLTFAAFVYWAFAYTMSRESQRLEKRLGVGER